MSADLDAIRESYDTVAVDYADLLPRRFRRVALWRPFAVPSLAWGVAALATFVLVPFD